jgi:hypothetical protein
MVVLSSCRQCLSVHNNAMGVVDACITLQALRDLTPCKRRPNALHRLRRALSIRCYVDFFHIVLISQQTADRSRVRIGRHGCNASFFCLPLLPQYRLLWILTFYSAGHRESPVLGRTAGEPFLVRVLLHLLRPGSHWTALDTWRRLRHFLLPWRLEVVMVLPLLLSRELSSPTAAARPARLRPQHGERPHFLRTKTAHLKARHI